jgi:hypothetical protein
VLYLDRPYERIAGCIAARAVQIQRLEGSRFVRAAVLWELNRFELLVTPMDSEVVVSGEFLSWVFMAADELGYGAGRCCQTKYAAVRVTLGAERAEMPRHRVCSRLESKVHAARLSASGGGRTSS